MWNKYAYLDEPTFFRRWGDAYYLYLSGLYDVMVNHGNKYKVMEINEINFNQFCNFVYHHSSSSKSRQIQKYLQKNGDF